MTPEAQRIAIAEACGWRAEEWQFGGWTCCNPHGAYGEFSGSREAAFTLNVPDYLNDLSAMHEAEKVLKDWNKYVCMLAKVIVGDTRPKCSGNDYHVATSIIIHATAAQRAEAFLRTIGRWVEA